MKRRLLGDLGDMLSLKSYHEFIKVTYYYVKTVSATLF